MYCGQMEKRGDGKGILTAPEGLLREDGRMEQYPYDDILQMIINYIYRNVSTV